MSTNKGVLVDDADYITGLLLPISAIIYFSRLVAGANAHARKLYPDREHRITGRRHIFQDSVPPKCFTAVARKMECIMMLDVFKLNLNKHTNYNIG